MKIKTLVIAPYPGLVETTSNLKEELGDFDITVIQGDLMEVIPHIRDYEDNNYDMIISRGGTARLIKNHTVLPVVEIKVSGYDILRMLTLVRGYKAKVEMIGFPNIIESIAAVSSIMGTEVPCREIHSEREAEAAIERAKLEGVMVVVGDTITVKKAKEAGLQGVLITSGRESVLEAFEKAKMIFNSIVHYRSSHDLYKRMVDRLEQGAAIFYSDGSLREANTAFYRLLRSEGEPENEGAVQQRISFFAYLIATLHCDGHLDSISVSPDGERLFRVNSEAVPVGSEQLYYLLLRSAREDESDLRITYSNEFIDSFPQLITGNPEFARLLDTIGEYGQSSRLIALYGEKGSGRRLLAGAGASGGERRFIVDVELARCAAEAVQALLRLIGQAGADATLYLRGCERLDPSGSRLVAAALSRTAARVVLCFEEAPSRLAEGGRLHSRLYRMIRDYTLWIPPIREHKSNLEEYIRTFIVKYNEMYGKQIVGARPEVMAALLEHSWLGNFTELRDTIRSFVRQTAGEYIETDVLAQLGHRDAGERQETQGALFNIHQTLDDIERDIIARVLEEEGMSQTKAAQRLGINRTTLWRKLKKE